MMNERASAKELLEFALNLGAGDAGLACPGDGPGTLPYALSIAIPLSPAILDEISPEAGPTYTYFNHYRSVNYLIDQMLLKCGLWLQGQGARYITVAASQSRPESPFEARYSHKKAACLSGLGTIGRNGLFLHSRWGPRVRLGTLFTDWSACESFTGKLSTGESSAPFADGQASERFLSASCAACGKCIAACPAKAIGQEGVDPERCSKWMKKEYQAVGRGAVCGICIEVCPAGKQ